MYLVNRAHIAIAIYIYITPPLLHSSIRDSACRALSKFRFSLQSKLQYDNFRQIPYREAPYTDKITDKLEARPETIYVWGLHRLIIAVIIEIEN